MEQLNKPKKIIPPVIPVIKPEPKKEISDIVFKVQILASMKPKRISLVTINHLKYYTYAYYYKGAYRYTIGEVHSVSKALEFKAACREAGFIEAFVAAFKNNKRVTDPGVFKRQDK